MLGPGGAASVGIASTVSGTGAGVGFGLIGIGIDSVGSGREKHPDTPPKTATTKSGSAMAYRATAEPVMRERVRLRARGLTDRNSRWSST
jgi:hypothetical protein